MATTIAIRPETRERLRTFGISGDTYDDILQKMMNDIERDEFVAWCRRRLEEDIAWVDLDDLDEDFELLDNA